MSVIAPAILTDNVDEYKSQMEKMSVFAQRFHLDVADGEFAPTFTLNAADMWWPPEAIIDIHAMVARPSEHVQALASLKPHLIIFHAETGEDLMPIIQYLKPLGIKTGVALLKTTVPSMIAPIIEAVDHVMIFSGELGKHGGTASMMQLEKVRLIRAIRGDIEIGWDGGVTVENVFSLSQGGVDVLNVGGTLATADDPQAIYNALVAETNRRSVI